MAVPNPNLPAPKNPQRFIVPMQIEVDSDSGKVTRNQVEHWLNDGLKANLVTLPDDIDLNSSDPMPFAFHGIHVSWPELLEERDFYLAEDEKKSLVLALDFMETILKTVAKESDAATRFVVIASRLKERLGLFS